MSDVGKSDPLGIGDLFGDLKRNWGWLLALGILLILLGAVGLVMTAALTVVSVLYFGILLLIGGGVQVVQAARCRGWRAVLSHVLIALLYIAAGIVILVDPVMASLTLTMVLAIFILVAGLLRLVMAWQHRGERGTGLLVLSGLLAVLMGVIILISWPVSGLWVIGLFVAIELLFNGFAYVALAMALRAR